MARLKKFRSRQQFANALSERAHTRMSIIWHTRNQSASLSSAMSATRDEDGCHNLGFSWRWTGSLQRHREPLRQRVQCPTRSMGCIELARRSYACTRGWDEFACALHIIFGRSPQAPAELPRVDGPWGGVRESPPPAQTPRTPWPGGEMAGSRSSAGERATSVELFFCRCYRRH